MEAKQSTLVQGGQNGRKEVERNNVIVVQVFEVDVVAWTFVSRRKVFEQ